MSMEEPGLTALADGPGGLAAPSTVEVVYNALKDDIIAGKRLPGELLRIDRIARVYGVGPTPLRETLQRLTAENLVIARGGRGFQVAPLTLAEFEDLNIARTSIELAALRLAIEHGGEAWEGRIVAAGYILRKWDGQLLAGAEDDAALARWQDANAEFHAALLSGCTSAWLLRVREGLASKCDRYRRVAVAGAGAPYCADVAREHLELQAAVLDRDADRACDLLASHYLRTVEAVRAKIGANAQGGDV